MKKLLILCLLGLLTAPALALSSEPIRLANRPALSPQGQWLAFDWNGDVWLAPSTGGEAKQLTAHEGRDSQPKFSPDGKTIAFISDREGSPQVFQIPVQGGVPRQLSFHTAGAALQEWSPDGQSLLIRAVRDHFWRHGERFFTISGSERSGEQLLFDDYGDDGTLSSDGKKLLFTREGEQWWRKGYHGSRAAQVWLFERDTKAFTKLLHKELGCRWPMWKPDGTGFFYVGEHGKGSNLFEYDFATQKSKQLTKFTQDSVVFPCIARDGSLIVFRHLFDLYSFRPAKAELKKLDVFHNVDRSARKMEHRMLSTASAVSFSQDGLEIALIAGGDLWVMDTELREPRQITKTPGEEANPIFTPDGQSILCTSDHGDRFAIVKVTRQDPKRYWWQNRNFEIAQIEMKEPPSRLKLGPDGKKLAYVRGRGDLWVLDLETKDNRHILAGWNAPDYDWSPDGKWLVCAFLDDDFNRDVWLVRADGTGKHFNLSRHPYDEYRPVWSPDGKMIAFAGRRAGGGEGANVSLVWLNAADDEKTAHDRKLEKALDKMKGRNPPTKPKSDGKEEAKKSSPPADVAIDFDRLHERVKRIALVDGGATDLFWSPDSKKLAFTGSHEGKPGTYVIDIGDSMTPKLLTATVGTHPVWLKQGNQIVWLVGGVPTSTPGSGGAAADPTPAVAVKGLPKGLKGPAPGGPSASGGGSYTFAVRQDVNLPERNAAIFTTCWHILRDNWYDSNLGNHDWNAIRKKYQGMAKEAPDAEGLATVVQMMLGELNGSHLGFTPLPGLAKGKAAEPRDATAHLGVRFDPAHVQPGLKIRDVLPSGPADKTRSRLKAGEVILQIDGKKVHSGMDLTSVLNGRPDREINLLVQDQAGKTREVDLRPISYAAVQALLYDQWLRHNRKLVEDASGGKLGYLHISQMSTPNFRKFEEELVSEGTGKDGLVIDVRENPGGSITDHLLTALTQPVHAITVPRDGGQGYPLDRKVYISWHKPIVVLCNQNSGSNAEIFSHAVKTLKRGQLVGVPTAGAVISTGAVSVMDAGLLRLPFRGWFVLDTGEDMELNGAVPHHLMWPQPGQLPQGHDTQLSRAIEVLQADVQTWLQRPQPKLRKATERRDAGSK